MQYVEIRTFVDSGVQRVINNNIIMGQERQA